MFVLRYILNPHLKEHPGSLHISTDCWTSPNHRAFVAFVVHLEHNGAPLSLLLDVAELAQSHSGENLAKTMQDVLEEFGIQDKVSGFQVDGVPGLKYVRQILSVICDNASSNEAMISKLEELNDAFSGEASLVRCFLHVVNLVAKTTIRLFDPPKKKVNATSSSINADDEASLNADLDKAYQELINLASNIEIEEANTRVELAQVESDGVEDDEEGQSELENGTEGWIDKLALLSDAERLKLDSQILPVRLAIVKVSHNTSSSSRMY
jgi:hypothetical protein